MKHHPHNTAKVNTLIAVTFILWFMMLNNTLFAQAPDWAWAKSSGTGAEEYAYDMVSDDDGNVYVCGFFFGSSITFENTTLTNSGDWNFFVVKYDASGNVLWAKNPEGTPEAAASTIATDELGNVYVAGSFWGNSLAVGDTTLINVNYSEGDMISDIFIIKYDPSGNVLWAKSMGGSKSEVGWCIDIDVFGNILLGGWFTSPDAAFDSIILVSLEDDPNALGDAFCAKLSSDGKVIWAKGAGTAGYDDIANSVSSDSYGNMYVIGSFPGPSITWDGITLANTTAGFHDIFVIKLDDAGNIIWLKSIGGGVTDYGKDIISDASGNIFITGNFESSTLNFGSTILMNSYPSTSDWFIAKFDSAGNELWANNPKGNGDETDWRGVACDALGDVYAIGAYGSSTLTFDGNTSINNAGNMDLFTVKYTGSGDLAWVKNAGWEGNDVPTAISVFGIDSVYVGGAFTSSTLVLDNTNLSNWGGLDFFIAKLTKSNVGINETEVEKAIAIYPNPSSDIITISFSSDEKGELQIMNLMGQTVFSKAINSAKEVVDVSKFPAGIYLIAIVTGAKKIEVKFLKQ